MAIGKVGMPRPTGVRHGITTYQIPIEGRDEWLAATAARSGMRDRRLRGAPPPGATKRQRDALGAYVSAGGSVAAAAALMGVRPSTAKRHLADLRARTGLTTGQLIYVGRAAGWLVI